MIHSWGAEPLFLGVFFSAAALDFIYSSVAFFFNKNVFKHLTPLIPISFKNDNAVCQAPYGLTSERPGFAVGFWLMLYKDYTSDKASKSEKEEDTTASAVCDRSSFCDRDESRVTRHDQFKWLEKPASGQRLRVLYPSNNQQIIQISQPSRSTLKTKGSSLTLDFLVLSGEVSHPSGSCRRFLGVKTFDSIIFTLVKYTQI